MWAALSRAPGSMVNDVDPREVLRKFWRHSVAPDSPAAYLLAVVCVAVASLIRFALGLMVDDVLPLATLFPAVLVASLLGGASSGVVALILGGVVGWSAFMPPQTILVP